MWDAKRALKGDRVKRKTEQTKRSGEDKQRIRAGVGAGSRKWGQAKVKGGRGPSWVGRVGAKRRGPAGAERGGGRVRGGAKGSEEAG